MRKSFAFFAGVLALTSSLLQGAVEAPNIVVILADDMGVGDVSHNGGLAPTPHLDRLAAEGMRFTDAHTSSAVCTPTRYALMTGRYNWRSSLKKGVLWGTSQPLIGQETILPRFLGEQGYHSSVVGKWHLGLQWQKLPQKAQAAEGETKGLGWDIDYRKKVKGGPTELGFDENFLFPASLDMPPYVYLRNDLATAVPSVSRTFWQNRVGAAVKGMEPEQCLADFARESRKYISSRAESGKPFFLYLALTSPHTPIVPSEKFRGKSTLGVYGDFLMETDWVVGEVLAELDQQGLAEDTLVIFTTDNGCSNQAKIPDLQKKGHSPNGPLRGHKADIYEGGHRVPFLVRWPGEVSAGSESARTICQTDIFATCADILQKKEALQAENAPDSFSFLPALRSEKQHPRPQIVHHSINGSFAIRKGDWKLCLCPGSGGWSSPRPEKAWPNKELPRVQLYNLAEDLAETTNLQEQHPEKVAELVGELVTLIANGRSTEGDKLSNDGAIPFHDDLLALFPELKN
ncbi:sulfatase family protein [Roseibacillus ishigakijimensis]|uniref:Arylsulfatase n=1 Tax=Roseibacillus ishigakijimensis TaxID=454146 RepID=A0A934VMV4_9BACT|nr:arylsulfatase [Roseibacillus ishigakijimensis]MBK1834662.1 arylsulfatase [Roseibacillus ishigakijimensis]